MRFRFVIADLMVLTVLCALVAYAHQNDPKLFAFVAYSVYLALLCVASLAAKFRQGNRKVKMFWKGAALFGWFYFVFGMLPTLVGGDDEMLLHHTVIGLGLGFVCGYGTSRLGTHRPCPGRQGSGDAVRTNPDEGFRPEASPRSFETPASFGGMLRHVQALAAGRVAERG